MSLLALGPAGSARAQAPVDLTLAAARAASVAGRWPEAEALYRQALVQVPTRAAVHRELAFVLAEQGRTADAIDSYETAVALDPRDLLALYNQAALVDSVEPRRALGLWARYIAAAADVPEERAFVGHARMRVRQLSRR